MQDEKKVDRILERFYNTYEKYNTKVLKELGEAIKKFDGISPSKAHILAQELKFGNTVDKLLEDLSKISGKSVQDLSKLLDEVAKENVEFSEVYYKAKNLEYVEYKNNSQLKRLVDTIKIETNQTFQNISQSRNIGFSLTDESGVKVFQPLRNVYNNLIDEAVMNVTTGVADYQSAMRNTIKQLADSGVKVNEAKVAYNNYRVRIDSAVRQSVLNGIRKVNLGVQEVIGDEIGADGVEISAHMLCASDHLPYQGRQYTKEEFENINSYELDRPIATGDYNCGHFAFQIVLGVDRPSHTKKMLKEFKKGSLREVEYRGKKYTAYEATQIQRKFETAIRQQKDRQIIARSSGDKDEIRASQQKITQLTTEYKNFSKTAKLDVYKDRLTVSGYKRVKV